MKFYEVTDQIILTNHYVANNLFAISRSKWDSLTGEQQNKLMTCAGEFRDAVEAVVLKQEDELKDFFIAEGLKIYDPDRDAFRSHVLKKYQNSKYAEEWPEGLLEKIKGL
jgi:TRAP-type C4-dicarboxylate transport system substrate-binding protein